MTTLQAKLADAFQRRANLLARYNSRHPAVVNVEAEIRDIERSIFANQAGDGAVGCRAPAIEADLVLLWPLSKRPLYVPMPSMVTCAEARAQAKEELNPDAAVCIPLTFFYVRIGNGPYVEVPMPALALVEKPLSILMMNSLVTLSASSHFRAGPFQQ